MHKICIQHTRCPGDVVLMSIVPRELHRAYPGRFRVSMRTRYPQLWDGNPYIHAHYTLDQDIDPQDDLIEVDYAPQDDPHNKQHVMHVILRNAAVALKSYGVTELPLTEFKPYLHVSEQIRDMKPREDGVLEGKPYWVIMAGGKTDYTTKIWDKSKWQDVVYRLALDEKFPLLAQVGKCATDGPEAAGLHSPLKYTVCLLDKTDLAQLVWLIYHSRGVICGVTSAMHIAAALYKPCVVVAGGRESWWWDSYDLRAYDLYRGRIPDKYRDLADEMVPHTYIDRIGLFACCENCGCWKAGIGDKPRNNCTNIIPAESLPGRLPKMNQPACLVDISPAEVVGAVRRYEYSLQSLEEAHGRDN